MNQYISRRKWLKSTTFASFSLPFAASIATDDPKLYRIDSQEANVIKLSSNENPYGPSEQAKAAIVESLSIGNRYPNALKEELKRELARKENLTPEHILLAAGSTEILHILGNWLTYKNGNYLTTKNTFPILMMCTEVKGVNWTKIDLDSHFKVDLNRLENAINDLTDAVYICNPNNPTSTIVESADLENFCKNCKSHQVLLIDEAYTNTLKGG
ncbi:MAG: aminotransferase class I/II-fold pyridoxal phosphate-dependent enzyme [Bacteroidota bacterium]